MATWIKAESAARELFNNGLLEKYNKLESGLSKFREESTENSSANIQLVREECKKPHYDNAKEAYIPEAENINQNIVMAGKQEPPATQNTIINDNPAVNNHDTLSFNNSKYDTLSTSVQKKQYEDPKLGVNHHSTNIVDEEGTEQGKISNKVNQSKIETEVNLTELIINRDFQHNL